MKQIKEEIYNFVKQFISDHGYSPSLDEIATGVGIRSKATVSYHLAWLKADGRVDWEYNKARTIRIL